MGMNPAEINDIPDAGSSGCITVHLVHLGEGYSGDYDPNDPQDAPLYRIDVEIAAEYPDAEPEWGPDQHVEAWAESCTTTACTQIVANDPGTDYKAIAMKAAALVDADMHAGDVSEWSPKYIMAVLSYWGNTDHPNTI